MLSCYAPTYASSREQKEAFFDRSEDDEGRETTRGVFQRKVSDRARELWKKKGTVEEKWGAVKAALCEPAEVVLGFEARKQPDWFHESEAAIKPLLEDRNKLYSLWQSNGQSNGQERDWKKLALLRVTHPSKV